MKVGTKFALAFLACAFLSVLVYSAVAASREVDRLEETVTDDLATLGRTLSTSVLVVWERDGEAGAFELVGLHDRDATIDVKWNWLDVEPNDSHFPRAGLEVLASLQRGEARTWVAVAPSGNRLVYAYVPLLRPGNRPAALELSRPLVREADLFWAEVRESLLTSTLVAAFATALALLLSSAIVSAPLARVTEQARRVGAGDLSHRLEERRGADEVATLVRELNAMCDQLRDARARAEEETDKRLRALEQLRHADRLRTVGTLASGIAHELGTPLNVIAMRAKMIATGEVTGDAVPEDARIILGQAERVTKIVRQLLDFARRRQPNRAEVALAELAERTAVLLGGLAKKSRVAIAVERDAEVRANVDAAQIEQALTNLVINAIHAMPDGGAVTVRVAEAVAAPPDAPDDSRRCATIEVKDEGLGIDQATLERIFEPFFTTKQVGEGTGLGLSVTHGIVEDHGGWMVAESAPGAGATFRLFLPA